MSGFGVTCCQKIKQKPGNESERYQEKTLHRIDVAIKDQNESNSCQSKYSLRRSGADIPRRFNPYGTDICCKGIAKLFDAFVLCRPAA